MSVIYLLAIGSAVFYGAADFTGGLGVFLLEEVADTDSPLTQTPLAGIPLAAEAPRGYETAGGGDEKDAAKGGEHPGVGLAPLQGDAASDEAEQRAELAHSRAAGEVVRPHVARNDFFNPRVPDGTGGQAASPVECDGEEDQKSRHATAEVRRHRQQQQTGGLQTDKHDNPAALGTKLFHAPRRRQLQQRSRELRQRGEQSGEGLAGANGEREGGEVRLAQANHEAIAGGIRGAVSKVASGRGPFGVNRVSGFLNRLKPVTTNVRRR